MVLTGALPSLFISSTVRVDNTRSDDVSGRNQLRNLQDLLDHLPILKDVEDRLKCAPLERKLGMLVVHYHGVKIRGSIRMNHFPDKRR
jgi:hypothetical protein